MFVRHLILSKILNCSNLCYLFRNKFFLTVLSLHNIGLILKDRFGLMEGEGGRGEESRGEGLGNVLNCWKNQKHYIAYRSPFISPWRPLVDLMFHAFLSRISANY